MPVPKVRHSRLKLKINAAKLIRGSTAQLLPLEASNSETARENPAASQSAITSSRSDPCPRRRNRCQAQFLRHLTDTSASAGVNALALKVTGCRMSAETQIAQPPAPALNARVTAPTAPPAPSLSASGRGASAPVTTPTATVTGAQSSASVSLGFQLQIDPETQRLILESRDPVTGFILFQSPPKTAFSATSSSSAGTTRGKSLDRDI